MDWQLGTIVTENQKMRLAERMADDIIAAVSGGTPDDQLLRLFLTDRLPNLDGVEGVMFSGGVSEYVYGRESHDFQDMGQASGRATCQDRRRRPPALAAVAGGRGIRATALGLSEYSVQLSGNTIYVLGRRQALRGAICAWRGRIMNLPRPVAPAELAAAITRYVGKYELQDELLAYAFHWNGTPTYARIRALAEGLALALAHRTHGQDPIYVVLDGDIARTLGGILHDELHVTAPILIIDGIVLSDFDYIDFGRMRLPSNTVPVTIKSLLFSQDPRDQRAVQR